jgi:hypothetical protein
MQTSIAPVLLSIRWQLLKWVLFGVLGLAACYVVVFAVVLIAMLQPPERFGLFMKQVPTGLVFSALPASRMWLWARSGALLPGAPAPDFALPRHDNSGRERVTLSSFRGQRPVVLVFGSYT